MPWNKTLIAEGWVRSRADNFRHIQNGLWWKKAKERPAFVPAVPPTLVSVPELDNERSYCEGLQGGLVAGVSPGLQVSSLGEQGHLSQGGGECWLM